MCYVFSVFYFFFVVCDGSVLCWIASWMLGPGRHKADWSMHLMGDRWGTGQYCCSLQNFSAYMTCFLLHSSPVHLWLPLFPRLACTIETWSKGRFYACKWLYLPPFSFPLPPPFPISCLPPNLSSLVLSLTDSVLTVYAKKTKHGERQCCHRSSGRRSERGG